MLSDTDTIRIIRSTESSFLDSGEVKTRVRRVLRRKVAVKTPPSEPRSQVMLASQAGDLQHRA